MEEQMKEFKQLGEVVKTNLDTDEKTDKDI